MARKRPTLAQLRHRYAVAGWVGVGLLAGLLLGVAAFWLGAGEENASPPREASAPAPQARQTPRPAPAPAAGPPELPELPSFPPSPAESPARPPPEPDGPAEKAPRAAIIIDDLGNSWRQARAVGELPFPLAMAVLPDTPYADRTARRAHARGKEVLVHMPMEPGDGDIRLGPSFLRLGMDREELTATLRSNLAGIPFVSGINNHMGSALTARPEPMAWMMAALRGRGLFFIDSRTTADTRALRQARIAGVPAAERDVFLDHEPAAAAVREQFRRLLSEARTRGTAIGIGHPYPATIRVLREMLPQASARGVEIVPVQEVVRVRARARARGRGDDGALAYHEDSQPQGEQP